MVERKIPIFSIIAIILGASGLGLGAYSVFSFQVVEGPIGEVGPVGEDGLVGEDGQDGEDAPGGLIVRILDPDYGETVLGNIMIRALIYGSEDYTISILQNGTELGTILPLVWDTSLTQDGWWNITIIITDNVSYNVSSDEILVSVLNNPEPLAIVNACYRGPEGGFLLLNLLANVLTTVVFNEEDLDTANCFSANTFIAPEKGYYSITATVLFFKSNYENTDTFYLRLKVYSNPDYSEVWINCPPGPDRVSGHITDILWLNAGDEVYLQARSLNRINYIIGFGDYTSTYIMINQL